jgi:hypothetical protein
MDACGEIIEQSAIVDIDAKAARGGVKIGTINEQCGFFACDESHYVIPSNNVRFLK